MPRGETQTEGGGGMITYLDPDGEPLTTLEWAELFERRGQGGDDSWWRRQTDVGDTHVSTVWLGLNHAFGDGPPLFWETMLFGPDEYEQDQWRYPSREAAFAHHDQIVAALRDGEVPE